MIIIGQNYGSKSKIFKKKYNMQSTTTNLDNLNEQQRKAVVSEHQRLLVLAGAGSGKTKTLLQKIIYLIEEKGVSPSNILAITFTKNAANEMLDRLIISADHTNRYAEILMDKHKSNKEKNTERHFYAKKYKWINNITLRTFHSLCYSIIKNFGVSEFDNLFKIIADFKATSEEFSKFTAKETIFEAVHKLIIKNCESNSYILKLKKYILDYMIDKIHIANKQNWMMPKGSKCYTTLNGTKVRSKSEQYIADWFYRHSVKFEYEPNVNFRDFDFHPDFFIPEANLFIEHVSNRSYPTHNKEQQFYVANKLLVKTFEHQTRDTNLFNMVLERIVKDRLPDDFRTSQALSFEEEFRHYHKEIKDFVRQAIRVIDMIKVENLSLQKVYNKSQKDQHERVRIFYQLIAPVVKQYKMYCTNKSYLDFNDMIIRTIELFKNRDEIIEKYRKKYKYILVDEFQDVNNLQVELIKLLLTKNNSLFCVGDDWQSIYGFRGSNVDYIINFKNHFDNSRVLKLDMNYRSTEHIVGASNEVIKNNKYKINKKIRANKKSKSKILIYAGKNEDDNLEYVANEVKKLKTEGYKKEDILFLYRRSKMYYPYYEYFKKIGEMVSAKTIHAAKGLEAKVVFIIGLTEGYGGFPDIWMEDRIYHVVKESNYDLLLEEERRLFYVAITRAKDILYLITEIGNESSFLREIPDNFTYKTGMRLKPVVEKVELCKNCKNRLDDNFAFCPYCGAAKSE